MQSVFPKSLKTVKDRQVPANTLMCKENLNPNDGTEKKMPRKAVSRNQKFQSYSLTSTINKVQTIRSEKLQSIKKMKANTLAPFINNESFSNSSVETGQNLVQNIQRVRYSQDLRNMKTIKKKFKAQSQRFMQAGKSENILRDTANIFSKPSRLNSCKDQIMNKQTKPQPDSSRSTRKKKFLHKKQIQEESSEIHQIPNRPLVPKIDLRKNIQALDDDIEKLEKLWTSINPSHLNTQNSLWQQIQKQVEENIDLLSVLEPHVQMQYQTETSKSSKTEFHTSDDPFRNPHKTGLSSSKKSIPNEFEQRGTHVRELQDEEHLMAMLEFMHFNLNKDPNFHQYSNYMKSHYKQPSNRAILDLVIKVIAFYKND